MKKTLIALMALAGVACGAYTGSVVDTWLDGIAKENKDYILSFTIDDNLTLGYSQDVILTLNGSGWCIKQQDGMYMGLANGSGLAPDGSYDSRNDFSQNYEIDMDPSGSTADFSGWFYEGKTFGTSLRGLTITIDADYNGTDIILSIPTELSGQTEVRTVTLNRNGRVVVTGLDFGHDSTPFISSATLTYEGKTYTIPEPATATLSLLALAGLAARRRRK